MSGCVRVNQPTQKSNPNLPAVKEFKAYPDRNSMALFWTPVVNMSGYYIQKYNPKSKKWENVVKIDDPYKSIYVDTGLKPDSFYKYRIATYDNNGIPSLAKEVAQKTLPRLSPVIPLEVKPIVKGVVKIVFRPHPNERVSGYIIEKFNDKEAKWEELVRLKERLNVEYLDKGLEDGRIYKYRIFAISYDGIKSFPSKEIFVSTYPKPPVVTDIQATVNLPKQIKITFKPVEGAEYYKVYRSNYASFGYKEIAKIKKNVFVDKFKEDGIRKYYKVTAVSPYKTESMLSKTPSVMGETLKRPATPQVSVQRDGVKLIFTFTSPDKRAVKYLVVKKEKISTFKSIQKRYPPVKKTFSDIIDPKKKYEYYIYEVDKYGLISKEPAVVEVDE